MCIYIYIYVCVHIYICVCMYACIYIYIYIHTYNLLFGARLPFSTCSMSNASIQSAELGSLRAVWGQPQGRTVMGVLNVIKYGK